MNSPCFSKAVREWHPVDQTILQSKIEQFSQFLNHFNSHGPSKGCSGRGRPKWIQHVSVPVGNQTANQFGAYHFEHLGVTKGTRVSPRIFLVPKPGCQPDTNKQFM